LLIFEVGVICGHDVFPFRITIVRWVEVQVKFIVFKTSVSSLASSTLTQDL
jgi:hypothetical protein